ncbi:MFS transporter [Campylobacter fetus]|uniref:MFS transporter n=1 Tax=Campylobacter fetus subsp. testudinum TaxID=1507806 RepID=A0AAX0H9V3_CAMFE|nr:MFS transporter [Campylobacter fetus]AGZ81425.1 metabolite/H+ symporter, major facilitator superfamily [Campylobacter fetus subsp. testudinum 03-427]AJB45173.1 MFS transporter [Campylobacter fetus subsp. testudinum]AVK80846.1 MFS transporter [Campylobacter fetus subsp. testudinum]EAI4322508.1 MHS family MFS transporter [Campylobacter fetus]EAI4391918.1 MHS family MFS transporter [Campylobacter fetus]
MSRGFSRDDLKILSLSSLGGMLEFYDFIIFVFFASYISHLFFPPTLDPFWALLNTYGTFAAGYLARPLGGIIMAHFGDKNGRKNMFMLSILLMVIPTFALGLMPTFESIGYAAPMFLILVRLFQGIAIGGELPGAWVFISEHAPKQKLYFSIGVLTSAVVAGILLGSIVTMIVKNIWSDDAIQGGMWRIPFIIGGVFGIISIYLRTYLSETPIFKKMQELNDIDKMPIKTVFKKHKIDSIMSMFVSWVLTGCIVVMILLMPNFMPEAFKASGIEVSRLTTIYMQMACIVLMCAGCFIYGKACDKFGVSKTTVLFSVIFIVSVFAYFYILYNGGSFNAVLSAYLIAGFFGSIGPCGAPFFMIALFPNKIRFSGISFSYNIAYAIAGGFTPPFAVAMVHRFNPMYLGYYMVVLGVVSVLCALWFIKFRKDINKG